MKKLDLVLSTKYYHAILKIIFYLSAAMGKKIKKMS